MTDGQVQQPTVEMRELRSATDNTALAGHLAGANVDGWVDLLLNHCVQRALTNGLMSIKVKKIESFEYVLLYEMCKVKNILLVFVTHTIVHGMLGCD